MDGIGGTIKNLVFRDVKSEKVNIENAEHFATYVNRILNGITSVYMPLDDVLNEPDDTGNAPKIVGTLEIHKIVRSFNEDGICKLQFFQTAVDEAPFHEQWYRKDGDPDVCGHAALPLSYNPNTTCGHCRGKYQNGEE